MRFLKQNLDRAVSTARAMLLIPLATLSASADDWPQWRGPTRDGISRETGLLRAWPEQGPRLVWRNQTLGSGYSTPAVVGPRVFVVANDGLQNESVVALSTLDGSKLWATRIGKVGKPDQKPNYPGARSTPTVVGNRLYALGSDGDLVCLESTTGKVIWRKHLREDFAGQSGIWAYSESPLVDGDQVVCTPGGREAALVALDKATGQVVWKCALSEGEEATYPSIIVTEIGGVRQYVQFLKRGLIGVEAATGRVLWRFGQTADLKSGGSILTPVAKDGYVYSAAGLVGGALAHIVAGDDGFSATSVYFSKKLPIGIGGVVLVGDSLYGASGQTLQCVEFRTGKIRWEDRSVGPGAVCYADDRLYLRGENGAVALLEASPDGYREKGRFTPPEQPDRGRAKAWSYPVVANGRLYLQDIGTIWSFDIQSR